MTFFGLPVTLFEKVPVILKKMPVTKNPKFCPWKLTSCPWQKKPKNCPWKTKSGRDNFCKFAKVPVTISDFCPWQNKKCPWQTSYFFSEILSYLLKLPVFFFKLKFIGHSFIRNPEISLFCCTKGGKRQVLFCLPLISQQHSRISQNYLEYKAFLFSKL